jgi:hypothetical protein
MKSEQNSNYWQHKEDGGDVESPAEEVRQEVAEPDLPQPEVVPQEEDHQDHQEHQETFEEAPIHWSAKEYISHKKNKIWFFYLALVVLAFLAADFFLFRSFTFSVLVVVMAVSLVIYSQRPPRDIKYALSPSHGLYIGEKLHSLDEFKAFGLVHDGEEYSIMLIPRKRFAPGASVYFPEEVGEELVDALGSRLPMEDLKLDLIDQLIRKLRI